MQGQLYLLLFYWSLEKIALILVTYIKYEDYAEELLLLIPTIFMRIPITLFKAFSRIFVGM
jgi:hypothetical protein